MTRTQNTLVRFKNFLTRVIYSDTFFVATLVIFAFEAIWIAVSSIYPMAFDEDTHLTKINYYAHHFNPFMSAQPQNLDSIGVVAHDPSYLYHVVMALPWRIVTLVTSNFTAQIIFMRFINIGLFVLALIIFRKVLLKAWPNKAIVNMSIFFVAFTPLIIQLAGQINYDNLMILTLAVSLMLLFNIYEKLRNGKMDLWLIGLFLGLSTITTIIKYTFMPIYFVLIVFLVWQIVDFYIKNKKNNVSLTKISINKLSLLKKLVLIFILLASFGLAFERYGMNFIRYKNPTPDCVQVIGEQRCNAFSIYRRGQLYAASKPAHYNKNPLYFTFLWTKHMLFNLMMAINGPASGYSIGLPMPLPFITLLLLFSFGLILSLFYFRKIFSKPLLLLLGILIVSYLTPLLILNYSDYLKYGRRVAVQGRYLAPLLPMLYLIFLIGLLQLFKRLPNIRILLASTAILCFLLGGGVITFILHSDQAWYWPNNQIVNNINKNAQTLLKPLILNSNYTPYWQTSLEF